MKVMRSLWVAFATLGISFTAIFLNAGSLGTVKGPVDVLENIQDTNTTVKYGSPFVSTDSIYAHAMQQTQRKNSAASAAVNDLIDALSHDTTYVDSVQDGQNIYKVVTVSADAGASAGHGSAVLYTFSSDYGASWSDYVTIDPVAISSAAHGRGTNLPAATADAVSFDLVANAKIARAGNTTYVAFMSSAIQVGGGRRGAPSGHVSLDNRNINEWGGNIATGEYPLKGTTLTAPDSNQNSSVGASFHVFVTATTDDGIHWSEPQMIPTAYDRFLNTYGTVANGYGAGAGTDRTAMVTYESSVPGTLQLIALGDGTSVDRVYLAWIDMASFDAASNGIGGVNARFHSTANTINARQHYQTAPRPIFAVLTFDNAAADTGSVSGMHYIASGQAFHHELDGTIAATDFPRFTTQNGDDGDRATWDKIQLHGIAHPNNGSTYWGSDNQGIGSLTWDKVWLVGHWKNGGTAAAANNQQIWAATFDTVVTFNDRSGGARHGLFPSFGSVVTIDHSGAGTAQDAGNAEEFNFDSYVDGTYENATLYVLLTSNFVKEDLLMETDGVLSANGDTNTRANTMYVVNLVDPVAHFGYGAVVSQVSYDETMQASGVVTYSNPRIVVAGNGTSTNGSASDDLVVVAFEARGITRDRIAGWAHAPVASNNLTGQGYLTIDNVYVRALLNSGASHYSGADGSSGFNSAFASRVDGSTGGTAFNISPTTGHGGHSTTRDSVSEDAVLLDLQVQRYANNSLAAQTFIGVTLRSATGGPTKSRVTQDRIYGTNTGDTRNNVNNEDLYFAYITLGDDDLKKSYDFDSFMLSNETTSADGIARYKQQWITGDAVVQSHNRALLNRNFIEVNVCYMTNGKKHNNDANGSGYETAIGLTAQDDAFRVLSKTFELGDLLDAIRSSSSGVCLIGREDEDADIRR